MTTMTLEQTAGFRFVTDMNYHFFVIGAGGTGGHLLPNLIRQMSIRNDEGNNHSMTIVDADDVEDKNLVRQNFTRGDLGKNKAEVMATRYGRAFGENISYIKKYVTSPDELAIMLANSLKTNGYLEYNDNLLKKEKIDYTALFSRMSRTIPIFIDATDNNKTRLIIETVSQSLSVPNVFISSGNEEKSGQVICSFYLNERRKFNRYDPSDYEGLNPDVRIHSTPSFFDIFPNAPLEKLPTEVSCAEATVSAPQNMIANLTAANIIFNFTNKLLAREPIRDFLVFFNAESLSQKTYRLSKSNMEAAMNLTPNNGQKHLYCGGEASSSDAVFKMTWEEAVEQKRVEDEEKAKQLSELISSSTSR